MWAGDVEYKTLTFPDDNSSNNGLTSNQYASTWTAKTGDFAWSISNFNNNNWSNDWAYIKCGRKKGKSENTPSTATIINDEVIDKKIQKVVVTLAAIDKSDYNSIKLYVASDNTFESNLQTIEATVPLYAGELSFNIPNPAENRYYKLEFDTKGSTSSNGHTTITKVAYCLTSEASAATPNEEFIETASIKSDGKQDSDGTCIVTSGNVNSTSKFGYSYGLKLESSSGSISITTPSGAKNAQVELLFSSAITNLKLDDVSTTFFTSGNGTDGYISTLNIPDSKAGSAFVITKGSGSPIIYRIRLTYNIASDTKVFLTTTDNMAGWRTFYDATQDYEVDANTKIYVAAVSGTAGTVELTQKDATKIRHGEAVILKTSAGDRKMVLTKTTGAASLGANVLAYAASVAVDGYRLGYKSGTGVAFYKYNATAPASGVVYIDNSNVNTSTGAHEFLAMSFGDDVTAINKVEAKKVENGVFFNLAGQQVAQPTKGLYIVNGRKVIVK